jgi:hypothetical protein
MDLQRDLADAELGGRLLVEEAAHDERQDLELSRCECGQPPAQLPELARPVPGLAITVEGRVDRSHQVLLPERLGQEVDGARLHRAHGGRNVSAAGDENDGWMGTARDPALQIEPAHVRELDIEDQACGKVGLRMREEFRCRAERDGVQLEARQQQ